MIETVTGLVFGTRLLTETSLIVQWLTPNLGRLATVAKGARRAKSPFHGKLDLFYLADFSFSRSSRSELHTLCEVSLRETHGGLRKDLDLLHQVSYCVALIERATETETPLPQVFDLMVGLLRHLLSHPAEPQTTSRDSGKAVMARLKPSNEQLRELRQFLHGFLQFHLGSVLKGRAGALVSPGLG